MKIYYQGAKGGKMSADLRAINLYRPPPLSPSLFYFLPCRLTFSSPTFPLFVLSVLIVGMQFNANPHRVGGCVGRFVGQRVVKAVLIVLQPLQK